MSKLDYLVELGIDVVWLSPIYTSPHDDNGYDISDYRDIDPVFGTLEDFDELLGAAHARGLKLIMDLVVNHTSDEHPWFMESRSSTDNPKRDWYWWRPARSGTMPGSPGAEPNNWRSFFARSAWDLDTVTGEYYLHLFSRKQPDLNWENPEVRLAIYDMMRWWLDRGADGFRMDVINMISKDLALPDATTTGDSPYGDGSPYFICGPRVHEFLQEMYRECFAGRSGDLLTVGETPGVSVADAVKFTDPGRAEVDMVFQFEHMELDRGELHWDHRPFSLPALKASLGRWQAGLASVGWNSLYWNNHDQGRVVSRFGDDGAYRVASAKMLATILHLHRGTPYIYQGEELAMTNVAIKGVEDLLDIQALHHYAEAISAGMAPEEVLESMGILGRDNARSPMQWDDSEQAGFTTGRAWYPVNGNAREINAAAAVADEESVYHYYRKLIALRHGDPVVAFGDFTMLLEDDPSVYAFTRSLDGTTLLVLGNFSSEDVPVPIPGATDWASAEFLLGNYSASQVQPRDLVQSRGLFLRPWEARIYRSE